MKKVAVRLGDKSYSVYIGSGVLSYLPKLLGKYASRRTACVVTQKTIWKTWGKELKENLGRARIPFKVIFTPDRLRSEETKSHGELLKIIRSCASLDGKGRGVFLIAFGGGVIGDVTGFAASIYRRGIPYLQIPTTLTAQVDSAIGGKTAVDLPQGKNLLGTVYQPQMVLADPAFLKSLPETAYRDGLAEVVKYAIIKDRKLLSVLEKKTDLILKRDLNLLSHIITECVKIKAGIVSRDEFDRKGFRLVLNFGHTVGHAIETAARYKGYTHGQAISIGMMVALEISDALTVLKELSLIRRTDELLQNFGLPILMRRTTPIRKIMQALSFDKKNLDGVNRFVLIKQLKQTVIHRAVPAQIIYDQIVKRRAR